MKVELREVNNRNLLTTFIHLPAALHSQNPTWMPTIYVDEFKFFDPKKNHQFDACDTIMLLAFVDGKAVGRIMGIIHHTYNDFRSENNARFGYFDCIDNAEVAHTLIQRIVEWAKAHDKKRLIGPYGFSDKDVQGLLIEGFDKQPLIDSACNPPYIVTLIENEGFAKEVDCFTYSFPTDIVFPESYQRIFSKLKAIKEIKLLEFTKRKDLKPYIIPVLKLVNRTYDRLYGFVPMTDTEIKELAARYLPIINPRFVKVLIKDGQVIAFVVAVPNLTKGIQASHGKMFPFGIFKILWHMRHTKQLDLMLGAVERGHQKNGLEVLMGLSMVESARQAGFKTIETHLILENNLRMRAEMERLGIPIQKRFRVYRKDI